jgi:hypothetical protein
MPFIAPISLLLSFIGAVGSRKHGTGLGLSITGIIISIIMTLVLIFIIIIFAIAFSDPDFWDSLFGYNDPHWAVS